MDKATSDEKVMFLTPDVRSEYREVISGLRSELKAAAGSWNSIKTLWESRNAEVSFEVREAVESVIGRDGMGPKVGQPAVDFDLKMMGSQERVRLSSFKGKRPVPLIFGSYT